MITVQGNPPNYDTIAKVLGFNPENTVFTYGDTLYNPTKYQISDNLLVHEEIHSNQQGHSIEGAEEWWERYLVDPKFRFEQELEAYRAQYRFVTRQTKDRNVLANFLHKISQDLSGPMYGDCCDLGTAVKMIKG